MMYKAFVRDTETKRRLFMEHDYPSKKEYARELRANGYSVTRIEPKALYDFVLEHTNCRLAEWTRAKKLWKEHLPLTEENMDKLADGATIMELLA